MALDLQAIFIIFVLIRFNLFHFVIFAYICFFKNKIKARKMKNEKTGTKAFARMLRKNPTPAEDLLWQTVRNSAFMGLKFRRQHPIVYFIANGDRYNYVVDFYCPKHKLIIELDGGIHANQVAYDAQRDAILKQMGYQLLRFKNEETDNIELVLKKIEEKISTSTNPFPDNAQIGSPSP